jgi:hypothetical protein
MLLQIRAHKVNGPWPTNALNTVGKLNASVARQFLRS